MVLNRNLLSLVDANDTYWFSIILPGTEQVEPLVGQGAIVAAAGGWLLGNQRADCEGEGVLGECTVFIVILTEVLTILAELLNFCPRGMYHIMVLWAI